jgi:hypothetical protein
LCGAYIWNFGSQDKYHFEVGHSFADPRSESELAWFYATSTDYLFANAVHPALNFNLSGKAYVCEKKNLKMKK